MLRHSLLILVSFFIISCNTSQESATQKVSITNLPNSNTNDSLHQLAATASKKGEWLKAAELYEKIYQTDASNEEINYEVGTHYLKANYPTKALAILINFDEKNQNKTAEFNGRVARIAKAYYHLGKYQEVLKVVANYQYPKMYRGLAREHLKALIQLKEEDLLAQYFTTYQQSGIYDDKGKSTNMGFLYRAICNELLVINNLSLLRSYAKKYEEWANKRLAKDKRNAAFAAFYKQDFPSAINQLKAAIANEQSPRHLMEMEGLLGVCYAENQELKKATAQIQKIHTSADLPARHDAFGAKFYHQARIESALNQSKNAIHSLKNALNTNGEFWSNKFREDGLLKDLFEDKDFEKLVKIKKL